MVQVYIGFFGRLNYNYRDMLFAAASMRHEGSTKFGANKKWGNFPSVSLAWEIIRTPFAEGLSRTFQSLKPRISYGVTGRSDFNAYQSLSTYSGYGAYYIDGEWINGYAPSVNANPDLAWEKSTAFNVGVDFVAFDSRLRGSVEYYDRRSQDLLYNYTAPQPPFIYNSILVNVGTTKNTGVEVVLDYDVLTKTAVKWTTGINWSTGKTKLTKLSSDVYQMSYLDLYRKPGVGTSEYFFRVEEGGLIGQYYGFEHAGIDENGLFLVYDNDGNAVPAAQADPSWKRNIGNGAPKHFLSWFVCRASVVRNHLPQIGHFRGAWPTESPSKRSNRNIPTKETWCMRLTSCGTFFPGMTVLRYCIDKLTSDIQEGSESENCGNSEKYLPNSAA